MSTHVGSSCLLLLRAHGSSSYRPPPLVSANRRPCPVRQAAQSRTRSHLYDRNGRAWSEDPTSRRCSGCARRGVLRPSQRALQGESEADQPAMDAESQDLADKANVEYTDFIRTSEDRHYKAVEHFWVSSNKQTAANGRNGSSTRETCTRAPTRDGTRSRTSASTPRRR